MNPTTDSHEGGLGVRDQIRRYQTAFTAVVAMVVIAALAGGYILAHENLKLPGWVPFLGKNYFTLKADIQTAQGVTPGQGEAVTIAGAKVGEIASVDLEKGVGVVTMHLTPQYARGRIYHDATLLLRPKTALEDLTVEVSPGTPASGAVSSGATIPLAQTAPNIDFDEFIAGLDGETRAYLQELLAGAGEGLKGNGKALSAALKRFDPTARDLQEIGYELDARHANTARAIHNFRLLIEALGGKDRQLSELVQSGNTVFKAFAKEEQSVQSTLRLLPGALGKARQGLGKLATAASVLGPTLKELQPFAKALGPGEEAAQSEFIKTTPIFKTQIRPFARQILPVINALGPDTKELSASFPELANSFSVLNELFNEFGYNPGSSKGGFLFFLDWANHDFNSVVSTADAHGALANVLPYFNCNVVPILKGAGEVNPTVRLLIGLLNAPTGAACAAPAATGVKAASAKGRSTSTKGLLSGLAGSAFGDGRDTLTKPSRSSGAARPAGVVGRGG